MRKLLESLGFAIEANFESLVSMMAAAQEFRLAAGSAATRELTRSTALAVLAYMSPRVKGLLTEVELNWDGYLESISLSLPVSQRVTTDVDIHQEFSDALKIYASQKGVALDSSPETLATAILEDAIRKQNKPAEQTLEGRLRRHGLKFEKLQERLKSGSLVRFRGSEIGPETPPKAERPSTEQPAVEGPGGPPTQAEQAVVLLESELRKFRLRPSDALKELFRRAAPLRPGPEEDKHQLTTTVVLFAAIALGTSPPIGEAAVGRAARSDGDWGFLKAFTAAVLDAAGSKYEAVRAQYFGSEPPPTPELEARIIEELSANTQSFLRSAVEGIKAPNTPRGIMGVDASLLALLRTTDANAHNYLKQMGVDADALHKRLSQTEVLGRLWREKADTHFNPDDPEVDRDALGRGPLAIAFARRLHRVWCRTNEAMPGFSHEKQLGPIEPQPARKQQLRYRGVWTLVDAAGNAVTGRVRNITSALSTRVLALRNADDDTKAAFVVHLDAPWGGGKTTFANFVARVLNPYGFGPSGAAFLRERYGEGPLGTVFLADPNTAGIAEARSWPDDARRPWIVVPFNAWETEHVSPPWWVFYQTIRKRCFQAVIQRGNEPAEAGVGSPPPPDAGRRVRSWFELWLPEIGWRLTSPKMVLLLLTTAFSAGLFFVFIWLGLYTPSKNSENPIGAGTLIAGLTFAGSLLWSLGTLLTESIVPGTDTLAERMSLGSGDPFERFRRHFRHTMERVKRPVVVVVDDLDRCKPAFVVDLVRGMQTLLRSPRVVFIILGDRAWIERAFEAYHESMKDMGVGAEQSFGARFAEKAIQMSFVLPAVPAGQQAPYVRHLLLGGRPDQAARGPGVVDAAAAVALRQAISEAVATPERTAPLEASAVREKVRAAVREMPEDIRRSAGGEAGVNKFVDQELAIRAAADEAVEAEISHRLEPLAPYFPPNPRQIKRIINAVTMYTAVGLQESSIDQDDLRWFQLALWVIVMTEWPATWRLLAAYPAVVDLLTTATAEEDAKKLSPSDLPGSVEQTLKEVERIRSDRALMAVISGAGGREGAVLDRKAIEQLLVLTPVQRRSVWPDAAKRGAEH
jgi:hypothetical protein